jgi:hypothetical protein
MSKRYKVIKIKNPAWDDRVDDYTNTSKGRTKYIEKYIPWDALPWQRTKTGRIIYRRKKHEFNWQRVSKIAYDIINKDIDFDKRDKYYVRMRAGYYAYYYAMCRMYSGFSRDIVKYVKQRGGGDATARDTAQVWHDLTFAVIDFGLDNIGPDFPGRDQIAKFARYIGEIYYDWLFNLSV